MLAANMPSLKVPFKHSISTQLLRVVFGLYFLVAIIVTVVQLTVEYMHVKKSVAEEIGKLDNTFGPGISNALWNMDDSFLRSILVGMNQIGIVSGVKVTDTTDDRVFSAGNILDKNGQSIFVESATGLHHGNVDRSMFSELFAHEFSIDHINDDGSNATIGTGIIYTNRNIVLERIEYGFLLILINSVIKTMALWFIFLYFSRKLLRNPLGELTDSVNNINPENISASRINVNSNPHNEIKVLEAAFNKMVNQISVASKNIEKGKKNYKKIYDNSEVSIWIEDFSMIYKELNNLRRKGVSDLEAYLSNDIQKARELSGMVKVTSVNNATLKLFGAENKADFIESIDSVFGDDAISVFVQEMCALWEGKSFFRSEVQLVTLSGEKITVILSLPLPSSKEDYRNIPVSLLDITDWKQAEETVRRTQKMDALGKLTSGVAHDYNNILAVVLGYTELLDDDQCDPERVVNHSLHIRQAADRGAKLTKKMLAFSRHKQHNLTLININNTLQELSHILTKTMTARIELTLELKCDLWSVELDSGDLEDVVINLCINALHAMASGGKLLISTTNQYLSEAEVQTLDLNSGEYVLLSITDTGSGMDSSVLERIFERFYSTEGEFGTGLGLSQVYGFVQRCGGAISVFSEVGSGSRFTLYFPKSNRVPSKPNVMPSNTATKLKGCESILVVDDEQALGNLASSMLSQQGYQVKTVNGGEQALSVLEKSQSENRIFDLIITDVIMPNMDGYQLASIVRKKYPTIKIQMVSGYSDERHEGIDGEGLHKHLLYKPYTRQVLLTRVRQLLDG